MIVRLIGPAGSRNGSTLNPKATAKPADGQTLFPRFGAPQLVWYRLAPLHETLGLDSDLWISQKCRDCKVAMEKMKAYFVQHQACLNWAQSINNALPASRKAHNE